MNVNTIISSLHAMSEEDVRKINEAAYGILHTSRRNKISQAKRSMHVGQQVSFGDFPKRTGTIVKINRTKCVVVVGGGCRYNVPITMIRDAGV